MFYKSEILKLLNDEHIQYELAEHPAVFTIDEMLAQNLPHPETIAKNLFIRDEKKRNYYLFIVREDKKINLKELRKKLGLRPLSFASEPDLEAILKLRTGSVSPFGILNDQEHKVKIYLDQSFKDQLIGVHPNDNTATLWLSTNELVKIIEQQGNELHFTDF